MAIHTTASGSVRAPIACKTLAAACKRAAAGARAAGSTSTRMPRAAASFTVMAGGASGASAADAKSTLTMPSTLRPCIEPETSPGEAVNEPAETSSPPWSLQENPDPEIVLGQSNCTVRTVTSLSPTRMP